MDKDQEKEIVSLMRAARKKARGYADHFGWAIDRDLEEWGVVTSLNEALEKSGETIFENIRSRGRGNDPPDCDASINGEKTAIEVTELVREEAVKAYKAGHFYVWADWDRDSYQEAVSKLITRKDGRFSSLKGGPYPGGYTLVIFTDEPLLNNEAVANFLKDYKVPEIENITDIYFLISYDPDIESYPYFKIK